MRGPPATPSPLRRITCSVPWLAPGPRGHFARPLPLVAVPGGRGFARAGLHGRSRRSGVPGTEPHDTGPALPPMAMAPARPPRPRPRRARQLASIPTRAPIPMVAASPPLSPPLPSRTTCSSGQWFCHLVEKAPGSSSRSRWCSHSGSQVLLVDHGFFFTLFKRSWNFT